MKSQIKSLLKKAAHSAGYDIRRRENAVFPYIRTIQFVGHSFQFWIADECGRLWYQEVIDHMKQEAEQLKNLVRTGDRILEVGCHHGFFTTLLAQAVGPSGFICAVEAAPENAMVAQAQISLNQLGGHANVIHAAGSDTPGSLSVLSNQDGGNNRILHGEELPSVEVQAITGDQLAERYGPFTFLKLDVEGFETKVLKGCARILQSRPRIAIEVHCADLPNYGSSVAEVLSLLHLEDYEGFMLKRPAYTLEPLAADKILGTDPVNLFLRPKKA